MKCENNFCIYQFKGKCILEKINIDSCGMCAECMYPDLDDKFLNQAKQKLLKKYKNTDTY